MWKELGQFYSDANKIENELERRPVDSFYFRISYSFVR